MDFALAGYDVEALLGFGGSGEVWRARECATGAVVALKRILAAAGDGGGGADLAREAAMLAAVQHEHLVRLRATVPGEGGIVLVLDYAAGGSLAALVAARGPLRPGEVITIATPLAQALAAVHARGLVHGDVTPANVMFTGAGKPLLADLGVARLIGAGGHGALAGTPGYADPAGRSGAQAGPAADVYGLAATCVAALTGAPPSDGPPDGFPSMPDVPVALRAALSAALHPDPARRPTAAAFARDVFAAGPASPVLLTGAVAHAAPDAQLAPPTHQMRLAGQPPPDVARAAPPAHAPPAHAASPPRAPRAPGLAKALRAGGVVAVAVALLAGAIGVGMVWAGNGPGTRDAPRPLAGPPLATAATPRGAPATAADWTAVLHGLDVQRSKAFSQADADALEGVYTPDSPALSADRATVARLVAAAGRARHFGTQLDDVTLVSAAGAAVVLDVTDELAAYDIAYGDGRVEHHAARGKRSWRITLTRGTAGWRIATIVAAGTPPAAGGSGAR